MNFQYNCSTTINTGVFFHKKSHFSGSFAILSFCKRFSFGKIYSDKAGKYRTSQVIITGLNVELSKSEEMHI